MRPSETFPRAAFSDRKETRQMVGAGNPDRIGTKTGTIAAIQKLKDAQDLGAGGT